MKRLFVETKAAFGPVDVLVNNAGVYAFQSLEDFSEAEYRREFDINVLGPTARDPRSGRAISTAMAAASST